MCEILNQFFVWAELWIFKTHKNIVKMNISRKKPVNSSLNTTSQIWPINWFKKAHPCLRKDAEHSSCYLHSNIDFKSIRNKYNDECEY